jgi:hypothetical protein
LRAFFGMIFKAYPDFHITVEDKVLDGWKGVTIERVTGHWTVPYTDPATGRRRHQMAVPSIIPVPCTSSTEAITGSNC